MLVSIKRARVRGWKFQARSRTPLRVLRTRLLNPKVAYVLLGSLSKGVSDRRTSTENEAF